MNWMNVFVEYIEINTKHSKFEIEIEQTVQGIFRKTPIRTEGILWRNINGTLHSLYRYVDHGQSCAAVYENVLLFTIPKHLANCVITSCGASKSESFSLLSKSEINEIHRKLDIPLIKS